MNDHSTGRLTVVGIGPGGAQCMTPQALAALQDARVVVGYKLYLELLDPELARGREFVSTGMMGEVERCSQALDRALAGENVAVVSSGDAGVYAMAGLVLELAEARGVLHGAGERSVKLDIEIVPGIPAVIGAAALLGAPLTHDFACVSLSDLLTPWERIEQRLDAAAGADFVLGIYNPRSKRRDWQLPRALEIIARHRAPTTPVGLVRQAYRQDQHVSAHTLGGFDPQLVDMLSLLIVGNSTTRFCPDPALSPDPALDPGLSLADPSGDAPRIRLLTPRGYAKKYDLTTSKTPDT